MTSLSQDDGLLVIGHTPECPDKDNLRLKYIGIYQLNTHIYTKIIRRGNALTLMHTNLFHTGLYGFYRPALLGVISKVI